MATTIKTLPVEYLSALDEVLAGATYASRYDVGGAEFVSGHQVSVPDIDFGSNADPVNYNRFASEADVTLNRTVYTLDNDVEKSFYVDAVNVIDDPAAAITNIVAQYQRTIFAQKVDADFFAAVAKAAKTTATEAITAANVKGVIRAARSQFTQAGLSGGDLFVSAATLAALEDATERQWANETTITDTIGSYDGFTVFEVPDAILGADLVAVSGGTNTARYITKRAALYTFAPGQHTKGDGYLAQLRWVYGTIVRKNKKPGVFVSKAE